MNVNGYTSKAQARREIREAGFNVYNLLAQPEANPKLAKNGKVGVLAFPMHLAPANLSGFEVCPMRSQGCTAACLNTAGRGRFDNIQQSRVTKTRAYMKCRKAFMALLTFEIAKAQRDAKAEGMICGIRLNATSDLPWEAIGVTIDGVKFSSLMEAFGGVQFYDYTKVTKRAIRSTTDPRWPFNYHLTFSKAEDNDDAVDRVIDAGCNVAAVFARKPNTWKGCPVIDGDQHDYRPADGQGVVVGLKAKGDAKRDTSGFVVHG